MDFKKNMTLQELAGQFLQFVEEGKIESPVDIVAMCDRELSLSHDRIALINKVRSAAQLAAALRGYVVGVSGHG